MVMAKMQEAIRGHVKEDRREKENPLSANFCAKLHHTAGKCFLNPVSKYCKLQEKVKKSYLSESFLNEPCSEKKHVKIWMCR